MAILEPSGDNDLTQLWTLITELSEQLNQNRNMSVSLYGMAGKIKHDALNSQTGFVLRRFNMDKAKEEYDLELENMNAAISQENQALQHDNKQLNSLIKEYEQTLESLMSAFRNRARDVQEQELSLIRDYEAKLLAREEENAKNELVQMSTASSSLARLSSLLRQVLLLQNGEDVERPEGDGQEGWTTLPAAEYALEREIELARLEKENEELQRLIGVLPHQPRRDNGSDFRQVFEVTHPARLPPMPRGSVKSHQIEY